jgi:hypothetical protein
MNPIIKFLASKNGRIIRVVVGIALVAWGFFGDVNTWVGILLIVVGLVPLLAGAFDVCVFSPLFGGPFKGSKIRSGS